MKLAHYFFTRTIISYCMYQDNITFKASSASKPNNNKACKMKETFVFDYIWTQSKITMFLTLVKIEWNEHPQKLTQIKFSKLNKHEVKTKYHPSMEVMCQITTSDRKHVIQSSKLTMTYRWTIYRILLIQRNKFWVFNQLIRKSCTMEKNYLNKSK